LDNFEVVRKYDSVLESLGRPSGYLSKKTELFGFGNAGWSALLPLISQGLEKQIKNISPEIDIGYLNNVQVGSLSEIETI